MTRGTPVQTVIFCTPCQGVVTDISKGWALALFQMEDKAIWMEWEISAGVDTCTRMINSKWKED